MTAVVQAEGVQPQCELDKALGALQRRNDVWRPSPFSFLPAPSYTILFSLSVSAEDEEGTRSQAQEDQTAGSAGSSADESDPRPDRETPWHVQQGHYAQSDPLSASTRELAATWEEEEVGRLRGRLLQALIQISARSMSVRLLAMRSWLRAISASTSCIRPLPIVATVDRRGFLILSDVQGKGHVLVEATS